MVNESIPSLLSWMPRQRPEKPDPIIAIRRVAREFKGIAQLSWPGARLFLEAMRRDLIVDPFLGVRDPCEIDGLLALAPENLPSPCHGIPLYRISLVLKNAIVVLLHTHSLLP